MPGWTTYDRSTVVIAVEDPRRQGITLASKIEEHPEFQNALKGYDEAQARALDAVKRREEVRRVS
jgi:hypothetical protein